MDPEQKEEEIKNIVKIAGESSSREVEEKVKNYMQGKGYFSADEEEHRKRQFSLQTRMKKINHTLELYTRGLSAEEMVQIREQISYYFDELMSENRESENTELDV